MAEGVAKVRFKCQGCREAKKFAEHCFIPSSSLGMNIFKKIRNSFFSEAL